jgi:hypothetical protein
LLQTPKQRTPRPEIQNPVEDLARMRTSLPASLRTAQDRDCEREKRRIRKYAARVAEAFRSLDFLISPLTTPRSVTCSTILAAVLRRTTRVPVRVALAEARFVKIESTGTGGI